MSTTPYARPPKNLTGKTVNGVRPGQRKAYRKATRIEIEQRVEWLADYIAERPLVSRTELHRVMRERYNVLYLTAEMIYIKRARELLSKRANMTKQEARELGVNLLAKLAKSGRDQIKIAAEKRLAEIYGYNAPTHVRVGDPMGQPLKPSIIAPTINFVFPVNERVKNITPAAATNGSSNGNGHKAIETGRG